MFISVVVLPTFKLSLDNANINFGYVEPGKTVELHPNLHYNEVKCVSNKGATWYLRMSVIGKVAGPMDSNVGFDSFKWMVVRSSGDGVIEEGWHPLTEEPTRAYTSGTMDSTGEVVSIQFKYMLELPKNAIGGNYGVNVVYTMTETP